jgi:hypothetical protein
LKCGSKSPETQDVYVYRARTNTLLGDDELIKYYQQYIDIVTKGPEEMAKATVKRVNPIQWLQVKTLIK